MNIIARFFVVVFVGFLAACEQGILGPTQEDFQQVKAGMKRDRVHDLLGQPDKVDEADLGGLSGTSETWHGQDHRLTVRYLNDEVKLTDIEPLSEERSGDESGTAGAREDRDGGESAAAP